MRRQFLVIVGSCAVLALAGCEKAVPVGSTDTTASTAPASLPNPSSAGSSPGPAPAPTVIPIDAFLALPKEMRHGDIRTRAEVEQAVPRLCGGEFSSRGAAAGAAVRSDYVQPDSPPGSIPSGVLYQTIRTYQGEGAAAFMVRLRAELKSCPTFERDGTRFRVRTGTLAGVGDEALTIDVVQPQTDLPGNPVGGEQTNRAVGIRVGDTITILWDSEYERSSSEPSIVTDFARRAVATIRQWRS